MSKDTPDNHISVAAVQQCFAPCVHFIHYYAFYQLRCGIVKNVGEGVVLPQQKQ